MKSTFYIVLIILMPTFCLTQQTLDFEYFKRSGKVDVNYFVKNDNSKSSVQSEFILDNISENQLFIIEFSNLRLGLDKNTSKLKQEKDLENYMLHVPVDPSSITLSTESLKFKSVTNDGLLADVSTDKANKKIEIYYSFYNSSPNNVSSEIQFRFKVEAVDGARSLQEKHKGGDVIKLKLTVKPNELHYKKLAILAAEKELYNEFKRTSETAYRIKFAQEYLSAFESVNQERSDEVSKFLLGIQKFMNPIDYDKEMYEHIVKFCVEEQEKERCQSLCMQYQDAVWDDPKKYNGNYLESAYFHRIELFADLPNLQWVALCEKFIQKFPSSQKANQVLSLKEEWLQTKGNRKDHSRGSVTKQNLNLNNNGTHIQAEQQQPIAIPEIVEEDEIKIPHKEDWASILIHDDHSNVIIRTGGLSAEGYVVEFRDLMDQRIKYDPSFVGDKKAIKLDDVLEGKFEAGDYKISVFSKINRELLATNTIEYYSTKLPPELKYIMMVSCLALGFFSYKKYVKL